jgi:hypothetical protein
MQLQREQLAQGNLSSQFDLGQQQFNAGQTNQASAFNASAQNQASAFNASAMNDAGRFQAAASNQASQFGASAANDAARFNSGALNQFAQTRFSAEANMNQFNTGAQNQFAQTQFAANNQFNLANMSAQNDAARFGAQTSFEADRLSRAGDMTVQGAKYNRLASIMGVRQSEAGQKSAAYEKQRGMFLEGMSQAASGAAQGYMNNR